MNPTLRMFAGILVLIFIPALTSCSKSTAGVAAERPPVAVEVTPVAAGDLTESIAVVGALTPKFQAEVKTEYSGTISEVYVTEWVRVAKGTILARFDARDADATLKAATASRMQAEVNASRSRRELERAVKLRASGLATQQQLDDARSAAEAAEAQLDAVRAQEEMARIRLTKTAVRAPMDGVVSARTVNPGDYIENMGSPRPMFRIIDNRRLELTVSVPSSSMDKVALGQPLSFAVDAVPGRTFEGRVSFINPAADEASRTVRVVALVDNADGALKSGLFAKGAIVTGVRKGVLRVPRAALLTWDPIGHAGMVYVVSGDRATRAKVTTGAASGDQIEISSGLTPGQSVVTRGGFDLRDGDHVRVVNSSTGA